MIVGNYVPVLRYNHPRAHGRVRSAVLPGLRTSPEIEKFKKVVVNQAFFLEFRFNMYNGMHRSLRGCLKIGLVESHARIIADLTNGDSRRS